jgi:hypothetical protein
MLVSANYDCARFLEVRTVEGKGRENCDTLLRVRTRLLSLAVGILAVLASENFRAGMFLAR